jgi:hypothetical protein
MMDRERTESESEKRRFDVKRYIPSALRAQDKTVRINLNYYSIKLWKFMFVV